MSMIKHISPAGWDWDRPIAVPIRYSSRGLIGADRQDFIKTAGHAFLPEIDNIKIAKDELPIHLIALGAYETYGANRNGDAFSERVCKNYHPTFVKFARYFNNHKNKPAKGHPHFGLVKASAWNDKMKRVELVLALNTEKSATDRNGGLIDQKALEKIAAGEDIPVSMACRVPYDVCSWCDNQAKTRDDYCGMDKCAAGGCADNLTRLVKVAGDLHHLHVRNEYPTWFDISRVFRPADRIAFGAKADWLTKAAADHGVFELQDYVKMAEDATAPADVVMYQDNLPGEWNVKLAAQIKLAYALARIEDQESRHNPEVYRAFAPEVQPALNLQALGEAGTVKCAEGLGALADRKIILPLREFAKLAGKPDLVKEAAANLPGIYQRMLDDDSLERRIEQNKFPLSEKSASAQQRTLAITAKEAFSLEKTAVEHRSMLSAIRAYSLPSLKNVFEKSAADHHEAAQLARDYAIYKVAALQRIAVSDSEFPLTARIAVQQNHVA